MPRLRKTLTSEDKRMVERYLQGNSLRQIAGRYRLSVTTVRRRLESQGVVTRQRGGSAQYGPEFRARVLAAYATGSHGIRSLSRTFGVSRDWVRNLLRTHGYRSTEEKLALATQYLDALAEQGDEDARTVLEVLT